jgi:hypothetical protein
MDKLWSYGILKRLDFYVEWSRRQPTLDSTDKACYGYGGTAFKSVIFTIGGDMISLFTLIFLSF